MTNRPRKGRAQGKECTSDTEFGITWPLPQTNSIASWGKPLNTAHVNLLRLPAEILHQATVPSNSLEGHTHKGRELFQPGLESDNSRVRENQVLEQSPSPRHQEPRLQCVYSWPVEIPSYSSP